MRSTIIAFLFGLGLAAATSAPAPACQFHATTAANDQTSPPQTADAQQPSQDVSY